MNLACMDVINIVVCAEWPQWHIMVHQLACTHASFRVTIAAYHTQVWLGILHASG